MDQTRLDNIEALYDEGRYEQALTETALILKKEPEHLKAAFIHAQCLWMLHRHEEALSQTRTLIAREPENPLLHWLCGDIQADLGRTEQAISCLERAAELDAYFYFYPLRLSQERFKQLLAMRTIGSARGPFRGFRKDFSEKAEVALYEAQRAASLRHDLAAPHIQCGKLLALTVRPQEAEQAFVQAIACDNRSAEAHAAYADFLMRQGDPEAAGDSLDAALRLEPDRQDMLELRRLIDQGEQDPGVLRDYWRTQLLHASLAPDPSSQELRRQIGLLMQIGDDPSRKFEQYLQQESDDVAIRMVYVNMLFERKDYDQAAKQLEQARKEEPNNPEILSLDERLNKLGFRQKQLAPLLRRSLGLNRKAKKD
ncbi:tetratricopeptide repeat protein [Saccharibacillus sacchari]|uniref:Tetratricopeptide repeat protein n=1 Tax=Saccharibacillus sacchari TaxID=456493 RepID=A0ACC6PJ73_9BACL